MNFIPSSRPSLHDPELNKIQSLPPGKAGSPLYETIVRVPEVSNRAGKAKCASFVVMPYKEPREFINFSLLLLLLGFSTQLHQVNQA
jgi:hypothetical protein